MGDDPRRRWTRLGCPCGDKLLTGNLQRKHQGLINLQVQNSDEHKAEVVAPGDFDHHDNGWGLGWALPPHRGLALETWTGGGRTLILPGQRVEKEK